MRILKSKAIGKATAQSSNNLPASPTKTKIILSFHKGAKIPRQVSQMSKLFLLFELPQKNNPFFESFIYKYITPHVLESPDWIGHLTYSFPAKLLPYNFHALIRQLDPHQHDMLILKPDPLPHLDMYKFAEDNHPGFLALWSKLIAQLGYGDYRQYGTPAAFYCNYWIMKSPLYSEYRTIALRAIELLESDPELVPLAQKNSNYKGSVTPEKLLEMTGQPHYTFHPFVMERLVCFWAHVRQLRILCPTVVLTPLANRPDSILTV